MARADIFTYTIHLPAVTDAGVENDSGGFNAYPFSWTGPLMFNAPAGSDCPTVCGPASPFTSVNANYIFAGFSFTADLGLSDAKVLVTFDQFVPSFDASKQIVFAFTEPDSFWSTPGTGLSFPSIGGTPSFTFLGSNATACTGCTIDIAESPSVPEPRWEILPAMLVAILVIVSRRRKLLRAIR